MEFNEFKRVVNRKVREARHSGDITFDNRGNYYVANLGNGITMSSRPTSSEISVCWGTRTEDAPSIYRTKHKATFKPLLSRE